MLISAISDSFSIPVTKVTQTGFPLYARLGGYGKLVGGIAKGKENQLGNIR